MNDQIYLNMQKHNKSISKFAQKDENAKYLKPIDLEIRTPFFRDIDKVLYSLSFVRYMDKTQVFTFNNNDHIQKRMLHVQYVSKIARTIGRALNLNEDLIEAASLGHDLGHTPYGHVGEAILNKISLEFNEGYFNHNINSVRQLLFIENYGKGLNITIQTLDAILCHNGETLEGIFYPVNKSVEDFLNEYNECYTNENKIKALRPMTLEGCVVRISDIIAYIGRDIEDGVRMGLVTWDDVPKEITSVLGNNNSDIVNTIILDIIKNSENQNYIKLSPEVFNALENLKKFNYENIYNKAYTKEEKIEIESSYRKLAKKYLNDLKTGNKESNIYKSFLNKMDEKYLENTYERIVIDYISGMTDEYFNEEVKKLS